MFKIFAVGNTLMKDDGISCAVLKEISDSVIALKKDIKIIIGETDYMYCIKEIEKDDIVIIIDSSNIGVTPGTVTQSTLEDAPNHIYSSQHQLSLPDLLFLYKEKIIVYLIGIEIHEINYGFELSNILKSKFKKICQDVLKEIKEIIEREVENNA